jgi:hypothetical protein
MSKLFNTVVMVLVCFAISAYATNATYEGDNVTPVDDVTPIEDNSTPVEDEPVYSDPADVEEDQGPEQYIINNTNVNQNNNTVVVGTAPGQTTVDKTIVENHYYTNTDPQEYTGLEVVELNPFQVNDKPEYVVIQNNGKYDANLKGWKLGTGCGRVLNLPDRDLIKGASVTVYTTLDNIHSDQDNIYLDLPNHQFRKNDTVKLYYEDTVTVNYA